MRGKVKFKTDLFSFSRITPAYAGKSGGSGGACSSCWDHPRLCGEKTVEFRGCDNLVGSPPPMRGKERRSPHLPRLLRITPAYAGKSQNHKQVQWFGKDHPRLCGEKRHVELFCHMP